MHYQGNLIPDLQADYQLFDRVVNVSASNAVPFGLRGTITGILGEGVCVCVCERERERERECVCVCVRESERESVCVCVCV